MNALLTITLPAEASEELLLEARSAGVTPADFLTSLLRRRAAARNLEKAGKIFETAAHAAGWNSEDDILREVS